MLKGAGENISDGLLIAMVLKGLPTEYKPFSVLITQSDKVIIFPEFKVSLCNFEEKEKVLCEGETSAVMHVRHGKFNYNYNNNHGDVKKCFACGIEGHKSNSKVCSKFKDRKYCCVCKSTSHAEKSCRRKKDDNESAKAAR